MLGTGEFWLRAREVFIFWKTVFNISIARRSVLSRVLVRNRGASRGGTRLAFARQIDWLAVVYKGLLELVVKHG